MSWERRTLLTGNQAAAWGAKLAGARVIPVYPITPPTPVLRPWQNWCGKANWRRS